MSKKPQKSSPASRHSTNGNRSGATEKAAAPAQSQNGKRAQQPTEQVADDNLNNSTTDQRVATNPTTTTTTTTTTAKMTNENHEQPQTMNNVAQAAPPPTPPNQRPDRKRSRPTVANAQEQKVIIGSELIEQVVHETKSMARHRNRLQPTTTREQVPTTPASGPHPAGTQNICAACAKPIRERYLLMALDKHWHEDCLKCACCDCRLGEVGSSLFTHSDKLLCKRDFLRIFGQHGHCAVCKRSIPPYEMVMRANEHAYHMDCFACQQCQYRFCVGDRYHLTEAHKIVCLLCHNETQHIQTQGITTSRQQEQSNTRHAQNQRPRGPPTNSTPAHQIIQPNSTSPGGGGGGHLSPEDDQKPTPRSQESTGDTSGSEPEVIAGPATGQQVAGGGGDSAARGSGEPSPSGQDFAELTNQRPTPRGPPTIKREPVEEEKEEPDPVLSTANKKRPPAAGSPQSLSTANAVTTAATTAGCVM